MGGQGHKYTWGWALIKSIVSVTAYDTTIDVCKHEGRPDMTITQFNNTYILRDEVLSRYEKRNGKPLTKPIEYKSPIEMDTMLYRLSFEFRVCHNHIRPSSRQQKRRPIRLGM